MSEGVTVLLPVWKAEPERLWRAFESMAAQTHEKLEILFVLNGSDDGTRDVARRCCARDRRAWMIELEQPNLAAALNVGLGEARHELIARMDADDSCESTRIARQLDDLANRPELAAIGTAYAIVDAAGERLGVVTPPQDPAEAAWRLLISNPFAHGSMLLRRSAVVAAGGYDERFERSQDYDLWLRLRGRVAAIPDVLYSLTRADAERAFGATDAQGRFAARAMAAAWAELERGDPAAIENLLAGLAARQDQAPHLHALEERLRSGTTLTDLAAWLWGSWASPGSHVRAFDVARGARVREVGRAMRAAGVERVWLWGAGRHTGWLLEHSADLGVAIAGVVDDQLGGRRRFGLAVDRPEVLAPEQHVLLSSDWHEDAMWASSASARQRGVTVWRVYGEPMCSAAAKVAA